MTDNDNPFDERGLLKDGRSIKLTRLVMRALTLTLSANAPITNIRSK
jgi:hypothetical protein